ncbi:MAG TPA: hypothetical protein VIP30_03025 [Stenotrophomonas sp.]
MSGLFGNRASLSRLETLILDEVRARLDVDIFVPWDRQVASINKVQRLPDGVEVNFYRMQGGKVRLDPAIAFPNQAEELLVAKVTPNLEPQRLVAKVWAVNGYLFSIEYVGGSKYFEEALGMNPLPEFEAHCELLADLSRSP